MMCPDGLALIRPNDSPGVAIVELARPRKRNAITKPMWEGGFRTLFTSLEVCHTFLLVLDAFRTIASVLAG